MQKLRCVIKIEKILFKQDNLLNKTNVCDSEVQILYFICIFRMAVLSIRCGFICFMFGAVQCLNVLNVLIFNTSLIH